MRNKKIHLILVTFSLFVFSGCGQTWWETLFERKNFLVIRGDNTVSNQTIELKPGAIVEFRGKKLPSPGGEVVYDGELLFTNGAKLIARGTPGEPIIFTADEYGGVIKFEEDSDGTNSVIEYCKFEKGITVITENSVTMQYCKFTQSTVWLEKDSSSIIKYNEFNGKHPWYSVFVRGLVRGHGTGRPEIFYNNFSDGETGLAFGSPIVPSIKSNNIRNIKEEAIYYSDGTLSVEDNYIADCNGKIGVDTDGSQSKNVIYVNPRTSPVPNVGAGW